MSPAERVKLLDAAMRSSDPQAYLDGVQAAFDDAGRLEDALAAKLLRTLVRAAEIETLMHMRAEWRGRPAAARHRSPRSA